MGLLGKDAYYLGNKGTHVGRFSEPSYVQFFLAGVIKAGHRSTASKAGRLPRGPFLGLPAAVFSLTYSASANGGFGSRCNRAASVSPCSSGMTMNGTPLSSPTCQIGTTWSW